MSYEKVNPILEGLKIDEAGVRDFKETNKILSDINAKLKETNNVKLLQNILKYVTNEVDKDTSGTFTVANDTFHLPLQDGEGRKLYECINKLVDQKIINKVKSLMVKKFGKDVIVVEKTSDEYTGSFDNYNISPVPVKYVRVIKIRFDFYKRGGKYGFVKFDEFATVKKEINSLVENIFRKEMPDFYRNKFIRKSHNVPDTSDTYTYAFYEIPEY